MEKKLLKWHSVDLPGFLCMGSSHLSHIRSWLLSQQRAQDIKETQLPFMNLTELFYSDISCLWKKKKNHQISPTKTLKIWHV